MIKENDTSKGSKILIKYQTNIVIIRVDKPTYENDDGLNAIGNEHT
jgi:hypothetical protein